MQEQRGMMQSSVGCRRACMQRSGGVRPQGVVCGVVLGVRVEITRRALRNKKVDRPSVSYP